MAAEWLLSFERTVETYFTADGISGIVNDYFYTFPLAFITALVLTVLLGQRLVKTRKPYAISTDPDWIFWNWSLTVFNSIGFWILSTKLSERKVFLTLCVTTSRPTGPGSLSGACSISCLGL